MTATFREELVLLVFERSIAVDVVERSTTMLFLDAVRDAELFMEIRAAPSRCARQVSARLAQPVRTRTDAGTIDRPKSQVESHAPGQCLFFWPEAKARQGTTSALAELRVIGCVCKSAPYYSSVSSSLAPKDHPRRPAFMFLLSPIVSILYLARLRLPEAVRGRLFPSGLP